MFSSSNLGRSSERSQQEKLFKPTTLTIGVPSDNTYSQRHYRIGELAELWSLGRETVRKLVKDDPGVIKVRMGRKKANTTYSVPESAAKRIHTRLLNAA